MNRLQERALRIVLNVHITDFRTLFSKALISGYYRNIQALIVELYEIERKLSLQSRRLLTILIYKFRNLLEY